MITEQINKKSNYYILFVDDEEKSTKYFEKIFSKNFNILTANNTNNAFEIVLSRHREIAVIITDQRMPNFTGVDLLNKVKNAYPNIVRILTTAYSSLDDNIKAINQCNIFAYLTKPWNIDDMDVVLQNGLEKFETRITLLGLSGSIAHEIRNPLNVINLAQNQIQSSLLNFGPDKKELKDRLTDLSSTIADSVVQANDIINIILSDLKEEAIDPSDFVCLSVNDSLPAIVKKFGYKEESEKQRVKLNLSPENNFTFKIIPERFNFIICNLLKNALYYLKEYPNSIITVGTEEKVVNGINHNSIYVSDTGPGIPPHIIPKLFGDFFTSGKKEGTGLGLAFCKRNMLIFGGDVICESEFNQGGHGWTKFSLLFPKLSGAEIKEVMAEAHHKKILIVDDYETNLIITKSKIEKALPHIVCDIARSGQEAINMIKKNNELGSKYHLILMDIHMPEMSGIEAAKRIRDCDQEIPIIAITSLNKKSFLEEARISTDGNTNEGFNGIASVTNFNDYLSKSATDNILYRTLSKWMIDSGDNLSYLGTETDYLKILQGKKALLADDQQLNRMIIKLNLETNGLKIVETNDGKELLEAYQNSLGVNKKSSFDVIITDISMPPHNGDEAARAIRKIESEHNINYHDEIPIIALSGDGTRKDVDHFFECQMTDYFIKGSHPELLLKIVANCLTKTDRELEEVNDNNNSNNKDQNGTGDKILNHSVIGNFNKEDQTKLLNLFLNDSGETILKIESYQQTDQEKLLLHIHSLKGIAANIGADRLFNYVNRIELMLRNGGNVSENWLEELEKVHHELVREIAGILVR